MRFDQGLTIDKSRLLYTDKALLLLFIPIIFEQFLNSLMGMADTMMVSTVGAAAVSAVSLVDAVNNLIIQVFAALAAGATIICAQYLGAGNKEKANKAARQIFLTVLVISVFLMVLSLLIKKPLLSLIFGDIEEDVMENCLTYFILSAISYPFLALSNVGAALFRAGNNSRFPLIVSVLSNIVNVVLNALFIFALQWGVFGAAFATLISRVLNMVILFVALHKDRQDIVLDHYVQIRPDFLLIGMILSLGIPTGIENGMFQFGKLVIQSSVSTLGTTAIASQAILIVLELFSSCGGMGVGLGLMTVVGQALGAGSRDEAIFYIRKGCLYGEAAIVIVCLIVLALTRPMAMIAGLSAESIDLCFQISLFVCLTKMIVWTPSFIYSYGMRAAGDVKFSMITSSLTMWLCRVFLSVLLIRVFNAGLWGVWIGMCSDWTVRAVIFSIRFVRRKWLCHQVTR